MLRTAAGQLSNILRGSLGARVVGVSATRAAHGSTESDEQFDARYEAYFSRPEIDGWEVRKGMNDILGMDLVPDPKIIISALQACRRVNDFALTVRWLEGVKDKCGDHKDIYSYISKEIRPTLDELGVPTIEEMGYDAPELALKSVFDE